MNNREYLLLFSIVGSISTIFIYGKKIGYNNLREKHYFIILGFFMGLCFILPTIIQTKVSTLGKIGIAIFIIIFGAVKYYIITDAQNSLAEMRKNKNKGK